MKTLNVVSSLIPIVLGLCSCSTIPRGVDAVKSFNKEKYLGKWYEIARLDFKYEREFKQYNSRIFTE